MRSWSNYRGLLYSFPVHIQKAVKLAKNFSYSPKDRKIDKIMFFGMGGSAIAAKLIQSFLYDKLNIPVVCIKNYRVPAYLNKNTLCFFISYSGNTEETLSCFQQALKRTKKIFVIASGGKLEKLGRRKGFAVINIPGNLPPRQALGYLFFIPFVLICDIFGIKEADYLLVADFLRQNQKFISRRAYYLAQKIYGFVPVIYASGIFSSIALRFKQQLAENAKHLSWMNKLPEVFHNEIASWQNPSKALSSFIIVILRDKKEDKNVEHKLELALKIFKKEKRKTIEIVPEGKTLFLRRFFLIYLLDFTSFYLAKLNKVNPYPIAWIDYLKNN